MPELRPAAYREQAASEHNGLGSSTLAAQLWLWQRLDRRARALASWRASGGEGGPAVGSNPIAGDVAAITRDCRRGQGGARDERACKGAVRAITRHRWKGDRVHL